MNSEGSHCGFRTRLLPFAERQLAGMKHKILWEPCTQYSKHRIPGLTVTHAGTVLAWCEARQGFDDWSLMDILLQRSEDGGKSFEPPILLARGTEAHKTVNNPVIMQDRNGRLHFLYCEDYAINGGRVLRRYSDDDGITWSDVCDLTASTLPDYRNVFALGPGHGICTPAGDLVVPVWMVPRFFESPVTSHLPSVIGTLFSRDYGETWQMGELLPHTVELFSPNETELALLQDGTVYLNCRLGGGLNYRGAAYSKTGYSGWSHFHPDRSLHDPCCFGSTASLKSSDNSFLLLFANCENKRARSNVVLKASTDGGKTWSLRCVIDAGRGGYVEMNTDSHRGRIYLLYEDDWGSTCHFVTVEPEELQELPT